MSIKLGIDNVYLNLSITPPAAALLTDYPNPPQFTYLCQYTKQFTVAIIDIPENYFVSIISFSLPLDLIPIFKFPLDGNQNNANQSQLLIGLINGATYFPNFVQYVNSNTDLSPPIPSGSAPYFSNDQINSNYYDIYSFTQFITMINNALSISLVSAGLNFMGAIDALYFYNPVTQLISLMVTKTFITSGYNIVMNCLLKNYLSSFSFKTTSPSGNAPFNLYQQILSPISFLDPVNGPYIFSEEYISLSLWYDLRKIIVTTNSIPITFESTPTFNPNSNTNGINGTANVTPIITDFIAVLESANDDGSVAVYQPTSQYRLVNMVGRVPLDRINLQFLWQDKQGNKFPIYISPNQTCTVKLGFFDKGLYKCGCTLSKKM